MTYLTRNIDVGKLLKMEFLEKIKMKRAATDKYLTTVCFIGDGHLIRLYEICLRIQFHDYDIL